MFGLKRVSELEVAIKLLCFTVSCLYVRNTVGPLGWQPGRHLLLSCIFWIPHWEQPHSWLSVQRSRHSCAPVVSLKQTDTLKWKWRHVQHLFESRVYHTFPPLYVKYSACLRLCNLNYWLNVIVVVCASFVLNILPRQMYFFANVRILYWKCSI